MLYGIKYHHNTWYTWAMKPSDYTSMGSDK